MTKISDEALALARSIDRFAGMDGSSVSDTDIERIQSALDACHDKALEDAAKIADKWMTDTQIQHGNGGAGNEIRTMKVKP